MLPCAHDHRPHLPLLSQTNAGTNCRNSLHQPISASLMTDLSLWNGSIRLAASVHGPTNAIPILFLHGVTLSRDSWDEIKDRLISRCCVWALDFRGHGHSDRAPNYDLSGYVSDAETALAAIGRPAIVVGHSLGACVAGVLGQSNPNVRAIFQKTRHGSWDVPRIGNNQYFRSCSHSCRYDYQDGSKSSHL